ncbi:hypothetical protein [Olsenella sp. An293]|uniref:hypothetical protein n=1 Tax=Olsenella sp. An293 TaxID=1965626 RepID=UPI000B3ADA48|nr:hypothetical protein [Olsenella sp. An293]OUO32136.1 hypothetical protein B5F85_07390 [Olsenella sp. An293]
MLSYPERAAQVMEHLVTCPSHGYSQYSRQGDGGTETVTLADGSTVTIATGDRDCSSSVIDAWEHALPGSTGGATYTGNMRRGFTESGCFAWHPWGDGYQPKRGDVYLNETHHTEMYLGGGKLAGFRGSERGTIDGAEGDQTGRESRISDVYTYSKGWDGILAYVGPEPEPEPTFTEDDMNCFIEIPAEGDVRSALTVWLCNDRIHDLSHPDDVKYVNECYKACFGKDMPVVKLSASKDKPEFQRLVQAIEGGIPSADLIPSIAILPSRSEHRADGNDGTE